MKSIVASGVYRWVPDGLGVFNVYLLPVSQPACFAHVSVRSRELIAPRQCILETSQVRCANPEPSTLADLDNDRS